MATSSAQGNKTQLKQPLGEERAASKQPGLSCSGGEDAAVHMATLHVAEVISHPLAQCLGKAPVLVKPPQYGMQQPELDDSRVE